jgi:hypothetical protein
MKRSARLLTGAYARLLGLYPHRYRAEYREELLAVFRIVAEERAQEGPITLARFGLRELRDYPFSLLHQHWRNLAQLEPNLMNSIKKPEWFFYPAWIILTALCVPIAFILSLIIVQVIVNFVGDFIYVDGVRRITEDYLFDYIFFPTMGLLMGIVQYGLLRRYLPRMGWWVLATAGSWLLGVLLILASGWLNLWTIETSGLDTAFIVLGLSIGVGQWLVLRRRLSWAGWWIGANVVGWALLAVMTGDPMHQSGLLALGFLPACVTAATLAVLMNRSQPIVPQRA